MHRLFVVYRGYYTYVFYLGISIPLYYIRRNTVYRGSYEKVVMVAPLYRGHSCMIKSVLNEGIVTCVKVGQNVDIFVDKVFFGIMNGK